MSWRRFTLLLRNLPPESILMRHLANPRFEDLPIETDEEARAYLRSLGL
jgi:hypothetical protein